MPEVPSPVQIVATIAEHEKRLAALEKEGPTFRQTMLRFASETKDTLGDMTALLLAQNKQVDLLVTLIQALGVTIDKHQDAVLDAISDLRGPGRQP